MVMKQLKVVVGIFPAVCGWDDVVYFHRISILEEPPAFPALPLLFL
jgi:hypothetical protein